MGTNKIRTNSGQYWQLAEICSYTVSLPVWGPLCHLMWWWHTHINLCKITQSPLFMFWLSFQFHSTLLTTQEKNQATVMLMSVTQKDWWVIEWPPSVICYPLTASMTLCLTSAGSMYLVHLQAPITDVHYQSHNHEQQMCWLNFVEPAPNRCQTVLISNLESDLIWLIIL